MLYLFEDLLRVGLFVGLLVGDSLGFCDELSEGGELGAWFGLCEGFAEGDEDCIWLGLLDGLTDNDELYM